VASVVAEDARFPASDFNDETLTYSTFFWPCFTNATNGQMYGNFFVFHAFHVTYFREPGSIPARGINFAMYFVEKLSCCTFPIFNNDVGMFALDD
jgi:hypothetical protein